MTGAKSTTVNTSYIPCWYLVQPSRQVGFQTELAVSNVAIKALESVFA